MKIGETNPLRTGAVLRRKSTGGAGAPAFSDLLDATGAESASPAAATSGISGVDMLMAQEVGEEEARRRQAVRQGHSMLDSLERLRGALLAGMVPAEVLRELDSQLARQRAHIADPALLAVLDDIELRVAVEKAKLDNALENINNENIPPNSY